MRVAVVGHVEWVEFALVDRVPASGEIAHAHGGWSEAGGGGAVAAVQLAKLAGAAEFYTALGDDELGRRAFAELGEQGVSLHTTFRDVQRRALTLVEPTGERTITTLGEKLVPRRSDPLPWDRLQGCDAVFFVSGDVAALRAARGARVLTATARTLPTLVEAGVELDAVIGSGSDPGEQLPAGALEPPPLLVLATRGAGGGTWSSADGRSGSWEPAPPPGEIADAYGCGDSFAAGFTFALARGDRVEKAAAFGARCGAACLTGRGPYEGQLGLDSERR
jgi:ribokinase